MPQPLQITRFIGVTCCALFLIGCQPGKRSETTPTIVVATENFEIESPSWTPTISAPPQEATHTPTVTYDQDAVQDITEHPRGSKVEISFTGPGSKGLDPEKNPFTLQVDVYLLAPDGNVIIVPAFYDGDGQGSLDGDVWKVRVIPYQEGFWHYEVHSQEDNLSGITGKFEIVSNPECDLDSRNLYCKGHLQYAGDHYLQFQNGEFWIKAGLDDPENFLGTAFGDWEAKREQIDLLSDMGINSIYLITNNIDGDRKDTWPWVGGTASQARANQNRFDVARLQAWEDLFSYAQQHGIVLHIVLNDDSAWAGYDMPLYIREMVARFGHHPGIIWNVGEEANEIFTDQEQLTIASIIREVDPHDHPVTVHRKSPWPFLGEHNFDLTSIQMGDGAADFSSARLMDYNTVVIEHRERSTNRGHPIPIMVDETPRVTEVDQGIRRKFRTNVLYPIFFAGGNFELHYRDAFGQGGSLSIEDLEPLIADMVRIRRLMEELPFQEMMPCNQLLSGSDSICFGDSDKVYLVYFASGGTGLVDLSGSGGSFEQTWFNPRTGDVSQADTVPGEGMQSFSTPDEQDWVLILDSR